MAIFRYSKNVSLANAKFKIKTVQWQKNIPLEGWNCPEVTQNHSSSFYKWEKEIFFIGLVFLFTLKIYFFQKKEVKKRAVWRHTLTWKLVFTEIHDPGSLGSASHGHKHGQFYLSRCGLEPTVRYPTSLEEMVRTRLMEMTEVRVFHGY